MSDDVTTPDEVITQALVREIDLAPFGSSGAFSLITLDNGLDHTRPNTFGPKSLQALNEAITSAEESGSIAIGITGKPFIFAAGADLSGISYVTDEKQALGFGKLGHDVFRRFGESKNLPSHSSMDWRLVEVLKSDFIVTIEHSLQRHLPACPKFF